VSQLVSQLASQRGHSAKDARTRCEFVQRDEVTMRSVSLSIPVLALEVWDEPSLDVSAKATHHIECVACALKSGACMCFQSCSERTPAKQSRFVLLLPRLNRERATLEHDHAGTPIPAASVGSLGHDPCRMVNEPRLGLTADSDEALGWLPFRLKTRVPSI